MDRLLESSNEFVYQFLERSMIQTKQTRAVNALNATEDNKSFIFGDNSPLVVENELRKRFESKFDEKADTELLPY